METPQAPPEPLDRALREHVFAPLRADRVLYRDEALLAIDKPAGVPSQARRAESDDDLPARVGAWLRGEAADSEREPYVGTHQRLDAETSGVVLFTTAPEANAPLAAQMEQRSIGKSYLAGVEGWRDAREVTLRDRLAPLDDGRVRVVDARDPRGKLAITHVKLREQRGDRALLEARIETGRTHQIRAQLAHAGFPIAGDAIYEGTAAPRLMLHAERIELEHPLRGTSLAITAAAPKLFSRWLEAPADGQELALEPALLAELIENACQRRYALGRAALRPE